MIYVTSDTHWGHHNILKYDPRPFTSIEEHDAVLVQRWNERVTPADTVYHLGDFCWSHHDPDALLARLNGTKILIFGNHDPKRTRQARHWAEVHHYIELKVEKMHFILFHYPISEWNGRYHGTIHLHGHSHGKAPVKERRYDVGTMNFHYRPVEIREFLSQK